MPTKYLKGECSHCGGHIEFPAESTGMSADCPHCGKSTELLLVAPRIEPTIPAKTVVWTIIAVLVLGLGLAGALVALKMAQKRVAHPVTTTPPPPTNIQPVKAEVETPEAQAGFKVSTITLEKTPGSSLVHAVGSVSNLLTKQRFGVKVTLDLLDSSGSTVGTASDYQQVIEPNGVWRFKALLVDSKALSAKLNTIKEDQ